MCTTRNQEKHFYFARSIATKSKTPENPCSLLTTCFTEDGHVVILLLILVIVVFIVVIICAYQHTCCKVLKC